MEILNIGNDSIFALLLTTITGLTTLIGGIIAVLALRKYNYYIAFALGFSASVMLYISVVEMIPHALEHYSNNYQGLSYLLIVIFIGLGFLLGFVVDKITMNIQKGSTSKQSGMYRLGIFSAFAITLHNLPEGMLIFITTLSDVKLGIGIALAVAIHNIPVGMAIAAPIYEASKSKIKALLYTLITGASQLVGALLAYFLVIRYVSDDVLGSIFAFVAGTLFYISAIELIPSISRYGSKKLGVIGFITGLFIMALLLNLSGHSH